MVVTTGFLAILHNAKKANFLNDCVVIKLASDRFLICIQVAPPMPVFHQLNQLSNREFEANTIKPRLQDLKKLKGLPTQM